MRIFVNVFPWLTGLLIILTGVIIIALIQFFRIRMFRRLFRELSAVFGKDNNHDYNSLVERIIQYERITRAGPSIEVIDLISNYIKRIIDDSRVFIHIAPDKATAESIIKEGFKYSDDFHKSAQEISSDLSDLTYKLQIYRPYGKFVMYSVHPQKFVQSNEWRMADRRQKIFLLNMA